MNFVSRHPLEDMLDAAPASAGINHLGVRRRAGIWSVLAHKGHESAVKEALFALEGIVPRFCGPQEWLVISREAEAAGLAAALYLIEGTSVVEQGDSRVVLALSGPDIRRLLAKLTAVDLHPAVFAIGQSANTRIGHVDGNIARIGDDLYEIAVMRSFAASVLGEIVLLGREFGLTVGFDG